MTLFIIIISIVLATFFIQFTNNKNLQNIFYMLSILLVFFIYFVFAKNSYLPQYFLPNSDKNIRTTFYEKESACKLDSKYKPLINSILNGHFYLFTSDKFPLLKHPDIYNVYPTIASTNLDLYLMYDMSYYKDKVYLYFGITPILCFYLPYYIATKTFLSDQILVLLLISFIFVFSLLILRRFLLYINKKIPFYIINLSILLIGLANYSLFLVTRPEIYEVCVSSATFLFIIAIYIMFQKNNLSNYSLVIIGLFCSLAVGCRPNYVVLIPIITMFLVYILIKNKVSNKQFITKLLFFLIPCLLYGIFLAFYNYSRFESIFEFGFKYQLNRNYSNMNDIINYHTSFYDLFIGLKIYLLQFPCILNNFPFFSSVQIPGKECMVGSLFMFPLIILIPFLFNNKILKECKLYTVILMLIIFFIINLSVSSVVGVVQRYVFEYMYIAVLLSLFSFYILYSISKYKKFLVTIFSLIFVWTLYINISVVLCGNNSHLFAYTNLNFYNAVINFLK